MPPRRSLHAALAAAVLLVGACADTAPPPAAPPTIAGTATSPASPRTGAAVNAVTRPRVIDVMAAPREPMACLRPEIVDPQIAAQKFGRLHGFLQDGWYEAASQAGMWRQVSDIMARHGNMLTSELGSGDAALGFAMLVVMNGGANTAHPDPQVRAQRAQMGALLVDDIYGCNDFARALGA